LKERIEKIHEQTVEEMVGKRYRKAGYYERSS
jgi:hypothetical protein